MFIIADVIIFPNETGLMIALIFIPIYVFVLLRAEKIFRIKEKTVIIKQKRVSEYLSYNENGSSVRDNYDICTVEYVIEGKKRSHTAYCSFDIYKMLKVGKKYTLGIFSTEIKYIKANKEKKKK